MNIQQAIYQYIIKVLTDKGMRNEQARADMASRLMAQVGHMTYAEAKAVLNATYSYSE